MPFKRLQRWEGKVLPEERCKIWIHVHKIFHGKHNNAGEKICAFHLPSYKNK